MKQENKLKRDIAKAVWIIVNYGYKYDKLKNLVYSNDNFNLTEEELEDDCMNLLNYKELYQHFGLCSLLDNITAHNLITKDIKDEIVHDMFELYEYENKYDYITYRKDTSPTNYWFALDHNGREDRLLLLERYIKQLENET